MAARQRLPVSPAKGEGGWILNIAGDGEHSYATKDQAVKAGASKGRQTPHDFYQGCGADDGAELERLVGSV